MIIWALVNVFRSCDFFKKEDDLVIFARESDCTDEDRAPTATDGKFVGWLLTP